MRRATKFVPPRYQDSDSRVTQTAAVVGPLAVQVIHWNGKTHQRAVHHYWSGSRLAVPQVPNHRVGVKTEDTVA